MRLGVVEAVLAGFRGGGLRGAVLYDVEEEAKGQTNLKECVRDAEGKVKGRCGGRDGWSGGDAEADRKRGAGESGGRGSRQWREGRDGGRRGGGGLMKSQRVGAGPQGGRGGWDGGGRTGGECRMVRLGGPADHGRASWLRGRQMWGWGSG